MCVTENCLLIKEHCILHILNMTVLLLGLEKFINIGIPADKLVLGVPWFGNSYRCLALKQVWRVLVCFVYLKNKTKKTIIFHKIMCSFQAPV